MPGRTEVLPAEISHPGASGANQVDASGVGELQAVGHAGRAASELQQQVVAALDDRTSFGFAHVADGHYLLRQSLRTQHRKYIKPYVTV